MQESVEPLLRGLKDFGSTLYTPLLIIDIGDKAIDPLLVLANSEDDLTRSNAYFVLSVWANAPVTTEYYMVTEKSKIYEVGQLKRIKNIFLKGLKDKFIDVRLRSIYGLKVFPDKRVIDELEKLATSDPYYESSIGVYPIRENAEYVINFLNDELEH